MTQVSKAHRAWNGPNEFEVERSKDFPEYFKVWCPYEDCASDGRPFLVHAATWLRPHYRMSIGIRKSDPDRTLIVGRSCPYCMRVGHPPKGISRKRRR